MVKFILITIIRMFASFVNYSMQEDIEVCCISESEQEELESCDDYETIIEWEKYFDEEEDEYLSFQSIELGNGDEYYIVGIEFWDEFDFCLITDDNYRMIYYAVDRYDD